MNELTQIILTNEDWNSFHIMVNPEMPKRFEDDVADALIEAYGSVTQGRKFKKHAVGKLIDGKFERSYRVSEIDNNGKEQKDGIVIDFILNENSLNLYFKNGIKPGYLLNQTFKDNFIVFLRNKYNLK
jgi:hypothetical protein